MYYRKNIKQSFTVRTDNKGSKKIHFQYRSSVPGDFLAQGASENPLGALYNLIINLNHVLRNSNADRPNEIDQLKIVDSFIRTNHSNISSKVEYQRLIQCKQYTPWSLFIIDQLDSHSFLKPMPFRHFNLMICWNGLGSNSFKGRSTHDILRDFAIRNRKYNTNLEAHRYGITKFIENFKKFCSRYLGFDTWNDEVFLKSCIEAGLFKEFNEFGEN